MEKALIILAIVVISMIHSWWKKRNGEGDEDAAPWPTAPPRRPPGAPPQNRPASAPPSQAANWEEELRRLLQGEEPGRSAPPVVVQQAPPPLPRAIAPRPQVAPRMEPVMDLGGEMETGLPVQMPSLEHSAKAFLRASQLEQRVSDHMHGVDVRVTEHKIIEIKKQTSPEIRQAVALVRNRQSQRAAIIAGIILGPPKAMEG